MLYSVQSTILDTKLLDKKLLGSKPSSTLGNLIAYSLSLIG